MNFTIDKALNNLTPGAKYWLVDDVLEWLDTNQTQPTDSEIQAEITRLQAEYDNNQYARDRKALYDKLNQDEMRFDDLVNGTTTWQDAIVAIKNKYPKGAINGSR